MAVLAPEQPQTNDPGPVGTHYEAEPEKAPPSWVSEHTEMARDWKTAAAHHAAFHLIEYGDVIQIGSGTTLNVLMDEIIERQRKAPPLDLVILTSNLQVVAKNSRARGQRMQIILTGGTLEPSLDSLTGEYAAAAVKNVLFHPKTVFFGAAAISFQSEFPIAYHFPDEISTQVAYATRPTEHRVILCDHTKLGIRGGLKAELTIQSLLANTLKCTILSTFPEADPTANGRIEQEQRALAARLEPLLDDQAYAQKDFVLRLVRSDGSVLEPDVSLSSLRAKKEQNVARRAA